MLTSASAFDSNGVKIAPHIWQARQRQKNVSTDEEGKGCVKYLNLLAGWWMGPSSLRACVATAVVWGAAVRSEAIAAAAELLPATRPALAELGEFANLTVIGSLAPSGIVPLSSLIARSASKRWSKRMKPTPFEIPTTTQQHMTSRFNAVTKAKKIFKFLGLLQTVNGLRRKKEQLIPTVGAEIEFERFTDGIQNLAKETEFEDEMRAFSARIEDVMNGNATHER